MPNIVFKLSSSFKKFNVDNWRRSGKDFHLYETYLSLAHKLQQPDDAGLSKYLEFATICQLFPSRGNQPTKVKVFS